MKNFKKRYVIKWLLPVMGICIVGSVLAWPHGFENISIANSLVNHVNGLSYFGSQLNGKNFLLHAKTARENDSKHIELKEPSFQTDQFKLQSETATLDIQNKCINCKDKVAFQSAQLSISTKRAHLDLS